MTRPSWPTAGSTNYVAETAAVIDDLQDTADDHETRVTAAESGILLLDARLPLVRTVGAYYSTHSWLGGSSTSEALNANRLYGLPFYVGPDGFQADRIGINVTTGASGAARLGVYAHNPTTFRPGALIDDCGTVDISSTAAVTVTIDELYEGTAPDYIVWLALVANATASVTAVANTVGVLGQSLDTAGGHQTVAASFTYAELPDPFTTSGQFTRALGPSIRLRAAA